MSLPVFHVLEQWSPFRIDALGLVSLLGNEELDRVLGQLTRSSVTDWLPMIGAYLIANNRITEPLPSFTLYNITDAITANDLAGWFSRWLICQDFTFCSSSVRITASPTKTRPRPGSAVLSYLLGILNFVPIVFSGLIGDWWGLANGVAMLASILVRQIVQEENRRAIDRAVVDAEETSREEVKVFVTLPNGRAVTIWTTRGIVIECLLTEPRPPNKKFYNWTRHIGWVAFGIHVISLGMASLFSQLLALALIIPGTILAAWQIGTDRQHIGRRLVLKRYDSDVPFRAAAYARMELSQAEEDSMVLWNLFPHRWNEVWWAKYQKAKEASDFGVWDKILGKSSSNA